MKQENLETPPGFGGRHYEATTTVAFFPPAGFGGRRNEVTTSAAFFPPPGFGVRRNEATTSTPFFPPPGFGGPRIEATTSAAFFPPPGFGGPRNEASTSAAPPPPPAAAETRVSESSEKKRWSDEEAKALLEIRLEMNSRFLQSNAVEKGLLWEEVSRALKKLGFHRAAEKCKEKVENVKKYYKRAGPREYKFSHFLNAIASPSPPPTVPSTFSAKDEDLMARLLKISNQQPDTTPPSVPSSSIPPPPPTAAPRVRELTYVPVFPKPMNLEAGTSSTGWRPNEVVELIRLRANVKGKWRGVWDGVYVQMKEKGFKRTSLQCRQKWDTVTKQYWQVKAGEKKKPTDSNVGLQFSQLDEVYQTKKGKEVLNPDSNADDQDV